jgi:hypothetical protein
MAKLIRDALVSAAVLLALCACSSFGPGATPPQRPLDSLHDDVAGLLIVFDLPRGLGPMPGASILTFATSTTRPVKAVLIPADVDETAGQLPPPGNGRAYYFLALSPADQISIRTMQAGARGANLVPANVTLTVLPSLCESEVVDPRLASISVLLAAPAGQRLAPLIDHRLVADVIGVAGKLPACP